MTLGSPCIDSGDPGFPYDPDGTIADMGALFFYHVAEVTIAPKNPPIIIPPSGGTFRFEATITNTSDAAIDIYVWTIANVPDIGYFGPLIKRRLHLSPHQIFHHPNVPQEVPGMAPAGVYHYIAYVGYFPSDKMDSSSFAFFKTGKSTGGRWSVGDWSEVPEATLPMAASLLGNHPNPFNSATTINYELSSGGKVKLEVFTLLGEKVEILVDTWQEAGYKSVSWEASKVSSGVYFYRLTVGDYSKTKRMIFTK